MTKYEQETILNYNQEEKIAEVYTYDKALMRRLDEICEKSSEIIVKKDYGDCKAYKFPKKWIKIKMPRQLSDEQKREAAERAVRNFGGAKNGQA